MEVMTPAPNCRLGSSASAPPANCPRCCQIILYNAIKPWVAACDLDPLIAPGPGILCDHHPRQGYYLLDEIRIADAGGLPERILSGVGGEVTIKTVTKHHEPLIIRSLNWRSN